MKKRKMIGLILLGVISASALGIGIYLIVDGQTTKLQIQNAQNVNSEQAVEIEDLRKQTANLTDDINALQEELNNANQRINELDNEVTETQKNLDSVSSKISSTSGQEVSSQAKSKKREYFTTDIYVPGFDGVPAIMSDEPPITSHADGEAWGS